MKHIINECSDCPFFDLNEELDRGLYSTDTFNPICTANTKERFKTRLGINEVDKLEPLKDCPLITGDKFITITFKKQ